jgi:hypothetical protein
MLNKLLPSTISIDPNVAIEGNENKSILAISIFQKKLKD